MTTRIQKGGAVFKPAVKARARAAPSGDTPSKSVEPKLGESSGPTLATPGPSSSTPAPSATQSQPPAGAEPVVHTPTPAPSQIQPVRSHNAPPILASTPTPAPKPSNLRPPGLTRATPVSSFSSYNRGGPPSLASSPAKIPPPAANPGTQSPFASSSSSVAGPASTFATPIAPSRRHPAEPQPDASFAAPDPNVSFDFSGLNHDMTQLAFPSSVDLMSAPDLGTLGHEMQVDQQVLDNSVVDNVLSTATTPAPEQLNKPRRGRSKKSTAEPDATQDGSHDEEEEEDAPKKKGGKRKKSVGAAKTTRKRKASQATEGDSGSEGETPAPPKRRKRASGSATPRARKKRSPSLPPFDPDADPGEEIDPTVVTMAFLCDDPGFGRVSSKAMEIQSNHAAWKARNKEKRAKLRAMMERKKYGRNESDDEDTKPPPPTKEQSPEPGEADALSKEAETEGSGSNNAVIDETGNGFDYSQDLTTSRFNVQVRIGPNGETIVDETSLMVDRDENDATEGYTHIVESDTSKFTNSGTYGKRYRGSRWSAEETELFFDALAQYGENYELIAFVLPGRDRKSCKNKFKAEDKRNTARINFALNNSKPVDMKTLSRMTGKDFSGPVPEIAAPPIPVIEALPPVDATQVAAPAGPVRKRSQSRKLAANDGVEIMGGIDDFKDIDDEIAL